MNDLEVRQAIEAALKKFPSQPLAEAASNLLSVLGYTSKKRLPLKPNTLANFLATFSQGRSLNDRYALPGEWKTVDFLFQLTDDEVRTAGNQQFDFESKGAYNGALIHSYLFFALELKGNHYSRSALAGITREVNKLFDMPALILFRYGEILTLAVVNRRLHKREEGKDVLEKVTLIQDIRCVNTHRAHIEVLADLSIEALYAKYGFTNFVQLHQAWQKTLDSSELNKRFFQEVANWYFWAMSQATFPKGAHPDKEIRTATSLIRLITRLIFCWFLKEKGLIPDALFVFEKVGALLTDTSPTESTYYKAILQNLFFATLNQEMDKREFRYVAKKPGQRDQHYMIHSLYRYEKHFRKPLEALKAFATVPFLNGGLFECLDKVVEKGGEPKVLRIDGFSDRSDNELVVPNFLFFGVDQEVDLNEIYGTSGKHYKVRGLINILDRYKFTVHENTPIEEEVALDPELLGKVFENLLANYNPETQTTARKQTGSFYTPREIVDYMVDESLLNYLDQTIRSQGLGGEDLVPRLRALIGYSSAPHRFVDAEVNALIIAIDRIKVLDPACGSGAFPMGVLLKLVHMLSKLDPGNSQWEERQISRVKAAMQAAEGIEDALVRDRARSDLKTQIENIEDTFQRNELDYGRKLYLIENCIFGVDIQPIAVQIAKLRFFISLIVNETVDDGRPNRGVRPLPNLETKFVAANTLVSIDRPKQVALRDPRIDDKEHELKRVRERYFTARTPATKEKYRQEDARLRAELAELFRQDGFAPKTAKQLASWNPYDQNTAASFFDPEWMFGEPEGFDIVTGNPPYMRVQGLQQTQPEFVPLYREHYTSAQGSFDIYALFVERGVELLNQSGLLTYILPHKFFQASFGQALRKLLTDRKALREVVRFGATQVFEEATTYTCLLFLAMKPQSQFELLEVKSLMTGREVLDAARERQEHPDYAHETLSAPADTNWDFSIGAANKVLTRLQQHPRKIGDVVRKIFQGIATSADKIYVLRIVKDQGEVLRCYSKHLEEEIEIERGLVKPFLMGKDVHRYESPRSETVVIFPYHIEDERTGLMPQEKIKKDFPRGWNYLKRNRQALGDRENGRMHGETFYAYIYPKNLAEFEAVKIMTPEIALGCQMTLDSEGIYYHTTKVYSFVFKPDADGSTKYFLGLLNSKVLWFFLTLTGYVLRGGYYTFKTDYLKPFPIPDATSKQQQTIETLADYVLHLKAQPSVSLADAPRHALMTAYFERLIDGVVYELYFPEAFPAADQRLSKLLQAQNLPTLREMKGRKASVLETLFERLYAPESAVRKAVFFLDTIETVQVIEKSAQ